MEAFSISPVTASHQTASPPGTPPGLSGLSDIFAALLQEATIRLDARPADLASFEARRTNDAPPRRVSAAETISALDDNDRRDDAGPRPRGVERSAEAARDPVEPITSAEEHAAVIDDGGYADPAPEHDAEPGAAAADEMPVPDETDHGDTQLAEGDDNEAPAPVPAPVAAPQDETDPALEEIAAPVALPAQAQQAAMAAAPGAAQAQGAGEAAIAALARAATQAQVPTQAAQQAQAASTMVPAATGQIGAGQFGTEVGAARVQITPATVVAQPNAALGGGAAVAALAAEAGQAAAQNGAQNAQAGVSTAASQMLAAATTAAGQNQAQPGNRATPVTGGLAPAGDAANGAQNTGAQNGAAQNTGAQNTGAQNTGAQNGGAMAASHRAAQTAVTAVEAAPASGLPSPGQTTTGPAAGEPGSTSPRNAQTAVADSNNLPAGNSSTPGGLSAMPPAAEAGAQNRLAQNARTDTAQSLGAPVPGSDDTASAEASQQPGASRSLTGAAQGNRSATLDNTAQTNTAQTNTAQTNTAQTNTAQTARAEASAQAGAAAQNASTGTAVAAERAMAPLSAPRTEGAGQVNANTPTAVGTFGLTQAAARTLQTLPAQARPATAASLPANQVAVHIQRAVAAGQSRITISLHPAELGQIDVKLNIGNDGAVKAIVTVERPETFELLQRDARGLEKALQDAGLKTDSGSLSFNLKGQSEQDTAAGRSGPEAGCNDGECDTPAEPEQAPDIIAAANGNGAERLLDLHV